MDGYAALLQDLDSKIGAGLALFKLGGVYCGAYLRVAMNATKKTLWTPKNATQAPFLRICGTTAAAEKKDTPGGIRTREPEGPDLKSGAFDRSATGVFSCI